MDNVHDYSIRMAQPQDHDAIVALGQQAGMGTLAGFETTLVATDGGGRLLGFNRIRIYDGIAHVNPIVVDASLRKAGLGRALMEEARARFGELRFVARGYAVGFYERIGCVAAPWESIAPEVAGDCDTCDDVTACHPLPMIMPR